MLYRFDPAASGLEALESVTPTSAGITEKKIELALAHTPEALFRAGAGGPPVLVVKKSVPYQRMADIIGLDGEGRLVLVECKRDWASRMALAQLLDYAADYVPEAFPQLEEDWRTGEGKGGGSLLDAFRAFSDDSEVQPKDIGKEQVLVVVATGKDEGFQKIVRYLESQGIWIKLVEVQLCRAQNGEHFLEIEPVLLQPETEHQDSRQTWLINTDETHCVGSWKGFLEKGVAGIWGYPDGPRTLQQGAQEGETIYAYLNGKGIIAQGIILDGAIRQVTDPGESVFAKCTNGNEWHIKVDWRLPPGDLTAISNSEVRRSTGIGLPVRNTFCRLRKSAVREMLDKVWAG